MSKKSATGLGKGFGSLLPQDFDQSMLLDKHDRVQKISVSEIKADPNQPRRTFDQQAINELAQSINRYGILQPLVVTGKEGDYKIVAGERRFRAAQKAGLDRVPVLIRTLEEIERLEISLIENVQRVDLNPVEQAVSIARLHEQFNISYPEIANRLGKAHSTVANIVRLLQLPEFARESLSQGKISEGHARQILALKEPGLQQELLANIEQNGWSVRQAEQFVSDHKEAKTPVNEGEVRPVRQHPSLKVNEKLTKNLSTKWGAKVRVAPRARGGGKIAIDFESSEQLEKFIEFLEKSS